MAYINDFSGNGNHLTNTNSLLSQISLAPIAVLNGTGHLKVANNASLSIAGDESYLQSTLRGLTFGGWFYMTSIAASRVFVSKWTFTASNNRSYWLGFNQSSGNFECRVSSDGTAVVTASSSV